MKKVQLIPNEAKLIQAMKKGHSVQSASIQVGITREAAYYLLKKLVRMGVVHRTGHKKNYQHEVKDIEYEIVERRARTIESDIELDDQLIQSMKTSLTQEQLLFYRQHTGMDRKELARRFGMTKLQFNFAILNAGAGGDKVCVKRK